MYDFDPDPNGALWDALMVAAAVLGVLLVIGLSVLSAVLS